VFYMMKQFHYFGSISEKKTVKNVMFRCYKSVNESMFFGALEICLYVACKVMKNCTTNFLHFSTLNLYTINVLILS
jgi:hypothetical protein